jgi:hypothetical protein
MPTIHTVPVPARDIVVATTAILRAIEDVNAGIVPQLRDFGPCVELLQNALQAYNTKIGSV